MGSLHGTSRVSFESIRAYPAHSTERAAHPEAAESQSMSETQITVLYDGECPLCSRELAMLKRIDRGRGRLGAIDIAAEGFDASRYGRDWETLMGRIHGVLPDGSVIEGVEVFRRAYAAVGRGWVLRWTRWRPFVRPVDAAYRWFARNRLGLTRRQADCPAKPRAIET